MRKAIGILLLILSLTAIATTASAAFGEPTPTGTMLRNPGVYKP